MKHFKEGQTENGHGEEGIVLGNVFSIRKEGEIVIFTEECDGYHKERLTKEDAVLALMEAIHWIEYSK